MSTGIQAVFTWDAVASVDGYNFYLKKDGEASFTKQNSSLITSETYSVEDIGTGTHEAYVTAVRSTRESDPSSTITRVISLETPTLSYDTNFDDLEWTVVVDAIKYDLYLSTDGGSTYTKENTSDILKLSYDVSGLATGEYKAYIIATDANGATSQSNTLDFEITVPAVPDSSGLVLHGLEDGLYTLRNAFTDTTVATRDATSAGDIFSSALLDDETILLGDSVGKVYRYNEGSDDYTSLNLGFSLRVDDMCVDQENNIIAALRNTTKTISKVQVSNMSIVWQWDLPSGSTPANSIALLPDQRIVYCDAVNDKLYIIAADGQSETLIKSQTFTNGKICVDADSNIYVAVRNDGLYKFDTSGNLLASSTSFDNPFDIHEHNGTLYLSDFGSTKRLRLLDPSDLSETSNLIVDAVMSRPDVLTDGTYIAGCGDQRLRYYTISPLAEDWEYYRGVNSNTRSCTAHPTRKF